MRSPLILLGVLVACTPVPVDPEVVALQCEDRARAAQGPTGSVTLGTNSSSGPFTDLRVGVTGDYLTGRDPNAVYAQCVERRTGSAPFRPPRLER